MTGVAIPYEQQPEQRHGRTRFKAAVAVVLLLLVAFVALLSFRYCTTGKPIADIAPLPPAVKPLLREPPRYIGSLPDVARPLGLAVTKEGTVYVTESAGERTIRVFNPLGAAEPALVPPDTVPNGRNLLYAAISPITGHLYVTDVFIHTVHVFTASGEPAGRIDTPFPDTLWTPGAITFDRTGNMYLTDSTPGQHRVLVFDPEGRLVRQFGTEGMDPGEFSFPNGIGVDKKGNIYVADSGNGRVQAFDSQGTYLWAIGRGTAQGDFALPRGLAVDDERNLLLVVDVTDQVVKVYDIAGATPSFAFVFGGTAGAGDTFKFPNAIALDGRGQLYITDRENYRVAVWKY